ncbi:hypothetical protein GW746_02580, partial [Candidatus Saccharibacteria bacterium]|nr:hypothetical protein [Candidatus Saccharibacteria bacterium]
LVLALLLPKNESEAKSGISASSVQSNLSDLSREFTKDGAGHRAKHYLGIGLIVVGAWLFLSRAFPEVFSFGWELFWPVALILVGILLLAKMGGKK